MGTAGEQCREVAGRNDIGEMAYVDPERRALADLMWEHRFGDRHTSMAVLVCGADPAEISAALHHALLTDDEMNRPNGWAEYPDPFGDWHTEPCTAADDLATESTHSVEGDR